MVNGGTFLTGGFFGGGVSSGGRGKAQSGGFFGEGFHTSFHLKTFIRLKKLAARVSVGAMILNRREKVIDKGIF